MSSDRPPDSANGPGKAGKNTSGWVNMENSLYIGMSREAALKTAMDLTANNIANVNTSGYRGQNPLFKEMVEKPPNDPERLSFVMDYGQYDNTKAGPVQVTGNTFDVALEGPGFFGVQTPNGVQYTRGGNFTVGINGELMTASGYKVASAGGGSITVPENAKDITITSSGEISTTEGSIGKLMVKEFDNAQSLTPQGSGLYKTDEPGRDATETKVRQGVLEGSNVQPVIEMTRMIEISRDYQSIQRFVQAEHDRMKGAIERLGRVV